MLVIPVELLVMIFLVEDRVAKKYDVVYRGVIVAEKLTVKEIAKKFNIAKHKITYRCQFAEENRSMIDGKFWVYDSPK